MAFQRAIKLQLNSGKPKEQLKTEQAVQVLLAFPRRPWRWVGVDAAIAVQL